MSFSASTNGGGACNAFPDVCKTPPGPGVPTPYPNVAQCSNAKGSTCAKNVKIKNKKVLTIKSEIGKSSGDEAGKLKGLMSQTCGDKVVRSAGYDKVKLGGAKIVTSMKSTKHNGSNANAPGGTQTSDSQSAVKCGG
jgi:hypothetical protein